MDTYCFKDACICCFNTVLVFSFIIIPLSILLFPLIKRCKKNNKNEFREFFKIHLSEYIFWFMLMIIMILVIQIMSSIFNNGQWGIRETTCLSTDMGDWGDFATCLTTVFTLISIFYAYRAFRTTEKSFMIANGTLKSQTLAAKRASFDTTFTQIFAQHKVLYDKAVNHKIYIKFIYNITNKSRTVFSACREEYEIRQMSMSVKEFWIYFNDKIELEVSIDFKNYFKYIYHEINIIVSQDDEVLSADNKLRYIQLIQAQMNYDELFCYLLNQIEYLSRFNKSNDTSEKDKTKCEEINKDIIESAEQHAKNLKDYKFFYELCKSVSGHVEMIKKIFEKEEYKTIKDKLIDDSWFYCEKKE